MAENLKNLEHDTLEDEKSSPAQAFRLEPTERDLQRRDAKRRLAIREEDKWLSIDNPAIWTNL